MPLEEQKRLIIFVTSLRACFFAYLFFFYEFQCPNLFLKRVNPQRSEETLVSKELNIAFYKFE